MIVAGVDPSLSSSGVVVGDGNGQPKVFRIESAKIGDSCWARVQRCIRIAKQIKKAIDGADRVFIENYAFGASFNREAMAELGGIIRLELLSLDKKLREIPPAALKMFVAGKGNARKAAMIHSVRDQWGYTTSNSDEADAYGLWMLGRCVVGDIEPTGLHQIKAVENVINPKQKKTGRVGRKKKEAAKGLF